MKRERFKKNFNVMERTASSKIASELMRIAAELMPKLVITVFKPEESIDDYITAILGQVEDIVVTVRRNEGLESQVIRHDTDDECEIQVLFTDHEAMRDICDYIIETVDSLAQQFKLNVRCEKKV